MPKFLLLAIPLILLNYSCKKKTNEDQPQLPPETQTGAMTFGCKVNGKVFVPRDGNGKPGLYVQYVNLGNVPDGGWHLNIPAYNYATKRGVSIETDSLLLVEGKNYEFKRLKGYPLTWYEESVNGSTVIYGKLDANSGSLLIKKHDPSQRIISGTFQFVGTNVSTGETITVTDGRFDIIY